MITSFCLQYLHMKIDIPLGFLLFKRFYLVTNYRTPIHPLTSFLQISQIFCKTCWSICIFYFYKIYLILFITLSLSSYVKYTTCALLLNYFNDLAKGSLQINTTGLFKLFKCVLFLFWKFFFYYLSFVCFYFCLFCVKVIPGLFFYFGCYFYYFCVFSSFFLVFLPV
jgi:hypothetical protein